MLVKDRNVVIVYECMVLVVWGEKCECLQKMLPRDEVAGCLSVLCIAVDIAKVRGENEGVPVCGGLNSSNSYSTGNPWSMRIDSKSQLIRWLSSWCSDAAANEESGQ